MQTTISSYVRRNRIAHEMQSSLRKRWQLCILPHHHAHLTQPIEYKESQDFFFFCKICPCTNNIVFAKSEDVTTFPHVFISFVKVFVR